MTYKVDIELGGQLNTLSIDAESESSVIEQIWNTYGYATQIIRIYNPEENMEV